MIKTNLPFQFINLFLGLYLKKSIKHIFIFPFYQTGGGERVHLNIVKLFQPKSSLTIFTNNSENKHFRKDFEKSSYIFEYNYLNQKLQKIFINVLCKFLNNEKEKFTLFGCNNNLFYNILPLIDNPKINKVDLIHAFTKPGIGFEDISIPFIKYLDKRVVICEKTLSDFKQQYSQNNIPEHYLKRLLKIENAVEIPNKITRKFNRTLNVCFVGRNSLEKRQHLYFKIAEELNESFDFYSAGSDLSINFVQNVGVVNSKEELSSFYQRMDILLLTSSREGFPMVIMEAMSFGVICISTNVGGIKEHLKNGINGFLIENSDYEKEIVNDFVEVLLFINKNQELLELVSSKSYEYANQNFNNNNKFNKSYLELLSNE